jgi:hypothetical protein
MALPTALLVLVTLTLLGTAAVFTSGTELSIAGNGRQELQALSVAEAGVHESLARLNMRTGTAPDRITTDVDLVTGAPIAGWSRTIVNKAAPGAGEVQTLTGTFGTTSALQISTVIRYKTETAEQPVQHCDGTCNGEVVHFHTGFGYNGTNVPTGGVVTSGPPVLQLESTYSDGASGATKRLLVEATRVATIFNFPASVRACGEARDKDNAIVNGSATPLRPAIIAGGIIELIPPAQANGGTQATDPAACSLTLFRDTFGMSMADMNAIADIVGANTSPPTGTKGKIIYVSGNAEWDGNAVIGTADEPVIVVVTGEFDLRRDVTVNGVIYVQGDRFRIRENAVLNGAVVIQGNAPVPAPERNAEIKDNARVNYNPNVLNNLAIFSPFAVTLWSAR